MSKAVSNARIFLVQGASRGIGLALTTELASRLKVVTSSTQNQQPAVIIASCRTPDNALDLKRLKTELDSCPSPVPVSLDIGKNKKRDDP